jgi:hypothetical protein
VLRELVRRDATLKHRSAQPLVRHAPNRVRWDGVGRHHPSRTSCVRPVTAGRLQHARLRRVGVRALCVILKVEQTSPDHPRSAELYSALIPSLIAARRNTCPCGACNDEPYGYCCKCVARIMWRRHHRSSRHRRRAFRLARRAARLLSLTVLVPDRAGGERWSRQASSGRPQTGPGTPAPSPLAPITLDDSARPARAGAPGGDH